MTFVHREYGFRESSYALRKLYANKHISPPLGHNKLSELDGIMAMLMLMFGMVGRITTSASSIPTHQHTRNRTTTRV